MTSIQPAIDESVQSRAWLHTVLRGIRHWGPIAVGAISLGVLTMHAYLGSYSRFMADDYCSAAEGRKFGTLRAAWYWYLNWNGRYSANVLDAFFGNLGPAFTPAVTAIVLLVWLAVLATTIFLLVPRLGGRYGRWPLSIASAAAILFLTFALAPDIAQSLYWGQGMRSIVPPLVVMTLYIGLFLFSRRQPPSTRSTWIWISLSFLLAYGAGGFSETYTALQLAVLGLTLATWFMIDRYSLSKHDLLWLSAGLLGAALAFITVVMSPGNSSRAGFYPPPPAISALFGIALRSYAVFFGGIFGSGPRILVLLTAMGLGVWIGASFGLRVPDKRVILAILLLGAVLTFSCFLPAAYGESDAPPDRTLLIPTFLLVLTAVALGISAGAWLAPRWKVLPLISSAGILLLVVTAIITIQGMYSLQPEYAAYARAWGRFHAQMISLRNSGATNANVSTADMNANNWAGLNVLGDNPKFWLNQCVSDYYGVKVISDSP